MIGLDRREQCRERIGGLLLASELTHAGQGYCIALALLGTVEDAALLATYLDHYLGGPSADTTSNGRWARSCTLTEPSAPRTPPGSWNRTDSGANGPTTETRPRKS
jgi:hypothetical protein